MKKMFSKIKKIVKAAKPHELAIAFSLIHSTLSYFYSSNFFHYNVDNALEKRNKLLISILLPVALFFIYWGIFIAIKKKQYHPFLKRSVCYFIVLMVALLLVWPGIWRHDDMTIAVYAKEYVIEGWQHVLTSIFYMLSYRIIPFFSGVIIVQCAIISTITAYLYSELLNKIKKKNKVIKTLLWIPFLLPPIIDSALYPLRPIIFSYLLILVIYLMIKYLRFRKLTWQKLLPLLFYIIICCTWRSEGIYLIVVSLLYFIYLSKHHKINLKLCISSIIIIVCGFLTINSLQKSISTVHDQNRYQLSGTVEVLAPLVRKAADELKNNQELLNNIDKVVSVETIINNPTVRGEYIFWTKGAVRENFTEEEYKTYLKSLISLAIKYPKTTIKNRIKELLATSAILPNHSNTIRDSSSYYDYPEDDTAKTFIDRGGRLMHPWNSEIRTAIVRLLESRTLEDYYKTTLFYPIFWNLIIPFIGILFAIINAIRKKKYPTAILLASILIKSAIVFITAPGQYHMYYLSEYLLGYILIAYLICAAIDPKNINNNYKRSIK